MTTIDGKHLKVGDWVKAENSEGLPIHRVTKLTEAAPGWILFDSVTADGKEACVGMPEEYVMVVEGPEGA